MVFSSLVFLFFFLTALFPLYWIAPKKCKNYVLLAFSILFYAYGGIRYAALMLCSIAGNYLCGMWMDKRSGKMRTAVLWTGLLLNFGLLCYFKYRNFFGELWNTLVPFLQIPLSQLVLPIGISFYTFQAVSYLVDLYRREIPVQKNPFYLALYISFFPQLIAGPIVQYAQIQDEITCRHVMAEDFSYGIKRFCFGFAKKVLISNELAWTADHIFAYPESYLSTPLVWLGAICYTFQIYYDFSGYSDMAIGLGRMFGFHFLENFNYPYLAKTVSEFWRRWHISLSSWFKKYLYIPLGGSRGTLKRTCLNLMVVFFATGIWHGAAWQFILWGLYYGLLLVAERLFLGKFLEKHSVFSHFYTLLAVVCGWVIFRSDSVQQAGRLLKMMFIPTAGNGAVRLCQYLDCRLVFVLVLAVLCCGLIQLWKPLKKQLFCEKKSPLWESALLLFLFFCSLVQIAGDTYNPFIYFRF